MNNLELIFCPPHHRLKLSRRSAACVPFRRANQAARLKWSRKQDLREPECNLGEDRDQRRAQAHQNKEWRSIERDTQDGRMRQALNDKQIEEY